MHLVMWIEPKADFFFKVHLSEDTHIQNDIWKKEKKSCIRFWNHLDSVMALIFHFLCFYPIAFTEMKYSLVVWLLDNTWNGSCCLPC